MYQTVVFFTVEEAVDPAASFFIFSSCFYKEYLDDHELSQILSSNIEEVYLLRR